MKKALLIILAALIAAVMLAACTGGGQPTKPEGAGGTKSEAPADVSEPSVQESTAPETGAVIEPEQLISKEEAAGLVGEVKDGEKTEQPVVGQKIVFYDTADGEGFLQISLTQQAFMSTASNTPQSIYTTTKDTMASENSEAAQGVGDEYFFGIPGLHILYKGYYICLGAGNSDDSAVRDILKQAGAIAVKNLDALIG